jgi:hypothetical protein
LHAGLLSTPQNARGERADGEPEPVASSSAPGGAGGELVDALALVERLPLTDAEKADAVRRLLAERDMGVAGAGGGG